MSEEKLRSHELRSLRQARQVIPPLLLNIIMQVI